MLLALTIPVRANVNQNTPLRTVIVPQADAPVRITNCAAMANDFVSTSSSPPQYLYTQVHTEFSFENTSQTPISAVRFGIEVDDSFNKAYGTFSGTAQGTFAPGVLIEPHRSGLLNVLQDDATAWNANVNGQDVAAVACYVQNVRYADGRIWTADLQQELKTAGILH